VSEPGVLRARYDRTWREVYGDMQDVGPVHRHLRRRLRTVLAGLEYADAVDVGCGAGHNLELLSAGRPDVRIAGADVSPEALRRARERGMTELFDLDIESGALPRRWDLVFSSLVLEHVADDEAALRHMVAMTRRHLVLATMAGDFVRYRPWEEQVGHVRNYRTGELENKLQALGATVGRTHYWGYPFYSPLTRLMQNRFKARASLGPPARVVARLLYALYALNSSRRGDLLIVHATVERGT
jgi:SAM-dependent methyltransferase